MPSSVALKTMGGPKEEEFLLVSVLFPSHTQMIKEGLEFHTEHPPVGRTSAPSCLLSACNTFHSCS